MSMPGMTCSSGHFAGDMYGRTHEHSAHST
jgi:hypothetical protein